MTHQIYVAQLQREHRQRGETIRRLKVRIERYQLAERVAKAEGRKLMRTVARLERDLTAMAKDRNKTRSALSHWRYRALAYYRQLERVREVAS